MCERKHQLKITEQALTCKAQTFKPTSFTDNVDSAFRPAAEATCFVMLSSVSGKIVFVESSSSKTNVCTMSVDASSDSSQIGAKGDLDKTASSTPLMKVKVATKCSNPVGTTMTPVQE